MSSYYPILSLNGVFCRVIQRVTIIIAVIPFYKRGGDMGGYEKSENKKDKGFKSLLLPLEVTGYSVKNQF